MVSVEGSAVGFTRYFGTVHADQPLEIIFSFSNEETVFVPQEYQVQQSHPMAQDWVVDTRLPDGLRGLFPVQRHLREVTDDDLPGLHYDGVALTLNYHPEKDGKAAIGDKTLVTIYGSALRISVKNVGAFPMESCRVFVRGSVF